MPQRGAGDKAVGTEAAIHGGGMEEKPMGEASAERTGEGGSPGGARGVLERRGKGADLVRGTDSAC